MQGSSIKGSTACVEGQVALPEDSELSEVIPQCSPKRFSRGLDTLEKQRNKRQCVPCAEVEGVLHGEPPLCLFPVGTMLSECSFSHCEGTGRRLRLSELASLSHAACRRPMLCKSPAPCTTAEGREARRFLWTGPTSPFWTQCHTALPLVLCIHERLLAVSSGGL